MQYILSEEELKTMKRSKQVIENDYNNAKELMKEGRCNKYRFEVLRWAVGEREDFPEPSEM